MVFPRTGNDPVRKAAGLSARDITVAYRHVTVLDGVSLDVHPGEFMVLLGPSGCGKSTLLAALAGLQALQSGRVIVGGRDVTSLEPAERNIAMVFQSYALYPTMTVANNIGFGMRMRGVPPSEAAARLAEVADMLQLKALLGRKPAQLSGGQRQRVAIARALVRDPDLFLFDEPLSSLDAKLRAEMRAEIKLLHQRLGTTVLYVTHDQVEAMTMASRIAVMREGRILQVDAPRAIYDRPQNLFVAGFVGSPGMNFVHGRIVLRERAAWLDAEGVILPLGHYAWAAAPAAGRDVVLGLRAEDVGMPTGAAPFVASLVPILVEPTGADTLVRLPFAGGEITARVDRDQDVIVGRALPVAFNLARASVFCRHSGQRL
jgi:multiple sugar transport system ATP-binding protein